jgi:hypothetical protein
MSFEWFPFLEGRYLSYSDYLALTGTSVMLLNYLVWLTILKLYKVYIKRKMLGEERDFFH